MKTRYTDQELIDKGILEIAPEGYLRMRTLSDGRIKDCETGLVEEPFSVHLNEFTGDLTNREK